MKRKETGPERSHNMADKTAGWLAGGIIKIRARWADKMGSITARMSQGMLKVTFVVCVGLMVACSSMLIVFSFWTDGKSISFNGNIRRPHLEMNLNNLPPNNPKSQQAVMPVLRFHKYLDSLSLSENGRHIRDSLLQVRPGLMDSMITVERLYCQ
jgi:hypothetical protein